MKSLHAFTLLALALVLVGACASAVLAGHYVQAQAGPAAAYEPLPPDLRAGVIIPVVLRDEVQKQYAVQDHYGEWVKLYRTGAVPAVIWMNLSTHQAWEKAAGPAATAVPPRPVSAPPR